MEENRSGSVAVMLYDGDCGFCQKYVRKWSGITRGRVRYEPYQEAVSRYPQVSEKECSRAVQLILPSGAVLSGARAVFRALALSGKYGSFLWCYEHLPLFGRLSEWVYRLVARHRSFFAKILE